MAECKEIYVYTQSITRCASKAYSMFSGRNPGY